MLLDGFDLVVLGTVLPSLLDYEQWHLNPGTASLISVVGLIGMTIGAITIGTVTDVIGRRKALLIAVTSFSFLESRASAGWARSAGPSSVAGC